MKKLVSLGIAAFGALLPSLSHAVAYQGVVTNVYPYGGSVYVAVMNGGFGGTSACPNGNGMVFRIDPSTDFGKTLMSVALTAKVTGLLVYAVGDGACVNGSAFGGASEALVGMDLKG